MKPAVTTFLGSLLVGLGLIAAAVGAFQSTRQHSRLAASTIIQIDRDESDLPSLGDRMPAGADLEYILTTEMEVIPSALILDPVIQSLDLNTTWGNLFNDRNKLKTTESREILKNSLKTTPVAGESRLKIEVTRSSTEDPVSIANRIADVYCDYRLERRKRIAENAATNFAAPFKQAEEPFLAAQNLVESARERLPAQLRSDPPQIAKGETTASLRNAQSFLSQLTVRSLMLSNQIASLRSAAAPDTNRLQAAQTEFERVQNTIPEAEARVNSEAKTVEALRDYWLAKEKLDSAEKSFAPYKKTATEISAMNSPGQKPPAFIIERAENAQTILSRDIMSGAVAAVSAVVLVLIGLPMALSNRSRPNRES